MQTGRRLTHHLSEQWREAYDIPTRKLSQNEREWLEEMRCSGDTACSPIKMAEEARQQMVEKQWMSSEDRDRFEKILTRIDKYARLSTLRSSTTRR